MTMPIYRRSYNGTASGQAVGSSLSLLEAPNTSE